METRGGVVCPHAAPVGRAAWSRLRRRAAGDVGRRGVRGKTRQGRGVLARAGRGAAMSLWVDKYRPCSLARLDYHKEQAAQLRNLVSRRGVRGSVEARATPGRAGRRRGSRLLPAGCGMLRGGASDGTRCPWVERGGCFPPCSQPEVPDSKLEERPERCYLQPPQADDSVPLQI